MRRAILAIVTTITGLVMLLSFKTHDNATSLAAPSSAISNAGTTSSKSTSAGGTTTSNTGSGSTTVTGDAADTPYGPVQVRITVKNGKVTSVAAVEYPETDPRDAQINAYAIPVLTQETLRAGNANIDMVSGATYTSDGYITSLQSALNKAGS